MWKISYVIKRCIKWKIEKSMDCVWLQWWILLCTYLSENEVHKSNKKMLKEVSRIKAYKNKFASQRGDKCTRRILKIFCENGEKIEFFFDKT